MRQALPLPRTGRCGHHAASVLRTEMEGEVTERRRFSRKERNTLYRSSGGVCASCGEPLATGWHADHRIPYSTGGHTRLSNGQALCPTCNTKKGSSMDWRDTFKPRHFQRELIQATRARAVAGEAVTVALVWPGSGKTLSYRSEEHTSELQSRPHLVCRL